MSDILAKVFLIMMVWGIAACGEDEESAELQLTGTDAATTGVAFGNVLYDATHEQTITLSNVGKGKATFSFAALPAGFLFKGGTYPGEGGNCGTEIEGETTCTIVVVAAPTGSPYTETAFSGDLSVTGKGEDDGDIAATLAMTATGYDCVETTANTSQTTDGQLSTFEATSSSDATAQSFQVSSSGRFANVQLKIQKAALNGVAAAFEKVSVKLASNCVVSGENFPCNTTEGTLATVDLLPAAIVESTTTDEAAKLQTITFPQPITLETSNVYWIVVVKSGHTAGYIQVARHTAADLYAGGEQLIGTYAAGSYSRFSSWDLYFVTNACVVRS